MIMNGLSPVNDRKLMVKLFNFKICSRFMDRKLQPSEVFTEKSSDSEVQNNVHSVMMSVNGPF